MRIGICGVGIALVYTYDSLSFIGLNNVHNIGPNLISLMFWSFIKVINTFSLIVISKII